MTLYSDFLALDSLGGGSVVGSFTPVESLVLEYQVQPSTTAGLDLLVRRTGWVSDLIGERTAAGAVVDSLESALGSAPVSPSTLRWHAMLMELENQSQLDALSAESLHMLQYDTPLGASRMLSMGYFIDRQMADQFAGHLREAASEHSGAGEPRRYAWAQPVFLRIQEDADGAGLAEQRHSLAGVHTGYAMGADDLTLGFAGFIGTTDSSGDALSVGGTSVGAQAGARMQFFGKGGLQPWLSADVSYSRHSVRMERKDSYGNTAFARSLAQVVSARGTAGADVALGSAWQVSPFVGIRQSFVAMRSYTESCEDMLSPLYRVSPRDFHHAQGTAGLISRLELTPWATWEAEVEYAAGLDAEKPTLHASGVDLPGFSADFRNDTFARNTVSLASRVMLYRDREMQCSVGYNTTFSDGHREQGASISVGIGF